MKVVGYIVSRSGSTRVPGKALLDINGAPMIARVIDISKKVIGLNEVCLATTDLLTDDVLGQIAQKKGISVYRGDPENVLDRLYHAALEARADVIVYIGGDCPLLDPSLVDIAIRKFIKEGCDYLCNYDPPTYPGGYDINIISFDALSDAYHNAIAPSQRVHAFSYLTFHPENFKICNFANSVDYSQFHWSVDYPGDIELARAICKITDDRKIEISFDNLIEITRDNPEIHALNKELIKPKVTHAFFSSPSMMKDITSDMEYLSRMAVNRVNFGEYLEAQKYYREIEGIAKKLSVLS